MKYKKLDRIGRDDFENAINLKRVPSSDEIMNVGSQPHIPTRGLSTIIKYIPEEDTIFKITPKELIDNKFQKDKRRWKTHHAYY